jgi:hypothetical protein
VSFKNPTSIGKPRRRLPVAAKIAFVIAGADAELDQALDLSGQAPVQPLSRQSVVAILRTVTAVRMASSRVASPPPMMPRSRRMRKGVGSWCRAA